MGHTPIDLIVVDDVNRHPIGRAWITVVFDVASRAVLDFHATLEAPSATSVVMALSMACLPKLKRLKELQFDFDWPMYGIPELLLLDNASVFHSFPDGNSALMLVAAQLRHIASTRWGKRRYLAMESLLNPIQQEAAACHEDLPPLTKE